jgi:hypothetical protein
MMDENLGEQLSLLVDDRLDDSRAARIFRRMEADREIADTYSRLLLVSQVLKTEGRVIHDRHFVDRIHDAIENEPTVIAPRARRNVRERVVTSALAATLAGVAVLVGHSILRQSDAPLGGSPEAIARAEISPAASEVDTYMVSHNGTSYLAANGGLMPYLRVVSHGNRSR